MECWPFAGSSQKHLEVFCYRKPAPRGYAHLTPHGAHTLPDQPCRRRSPSICCCSLWPSRQDPSCPLEPSPVVGTTVLRNFGLPVFPWVRRGKSWQGWLPGCSSNPLVKGELKTGFPTPSSLHAGQHTKQLGPEGGMCQDILQGW